MPDSRGVETVFGWESVGVHLRLETDDGVRTVQLGPAWFLLERGFVPREGDGITVTGSRIEVPGGEALVAARIVRDGESLTLRDEEGWPTWRGRGGPSARGDYGRGTGWAAPGWSCPDCRGRYGPGQGHGRGCCGHHGHRLGCRGGGC